MPKPVHVTILDLIREAGDCLLGVDAPRCHRARKAIQEAAALLYPLAAKEQEELDQEVRELNA